MITTEAGPGNNTPDGQCGHHESVIKPTPLATRAEPTLDATASLPAELKGVYPYAIRWEATLTPPETGEFNLGLKASGFFRVSLDGNEVTSAWNSSGKDAKLGRVHLDKGKAYKLAVDYGPSRDTGADARLVWSKVDSPSPEAVAAAKDADVVVVVVGITSEPGGDEGQ
jgi:beta-glucosidase